MQKSDFDYHLPPRLIAQVPASPRDASRLMCLKRGSDAMEHRHFYDLPDLLMPGDLLVINDSKVLPARLLGHKKGQSGQCELLLLRPRGEDVWECLAKPGRRLPAGSVLEFGDGSLTAEIFRILDDGNRLVRLTHPGATLLEKLDAFGEMPLPPYIHSREAARDRYQTVYAALPGSAAAPTAGLHFTAELLEKLKKRDVGLARLTLHVGLGTFRPVKAERIEDHHMHSEWYTLGEDAAAAIRRTKQNGGRVIAVGTTSCRALESIAQARGEAQPCSGETDIFIYPGYAFQAVDGLITNFHLPESTLIMLVAAFYGRERTLRAYEAAVREQYRFFSFGDAMLII